jgi:hypothetical protein
MEHSVPQIYSLSKSDIMGLTIPALLETGYSMLESLHSISGSDGHLAFATFPALSVSEV